jgi:hypothetical protein
MGRVITTRWLVENGFKRIDTRSKRHVVHCDGKQHMKASLDRSYIDSYVVEITYPCDCEEFKQSRLPAVHRSSA